MRVQKVQVKNFLSIKDSGQVRIDEKITVLIGKNESGKTNFLKALESFNGDYEYTDEDLCNYSGAREKLESKELEPKGLGLIKVWLEVEQEDKKKLQKIHKELVKIKHLEITKDFSNYYEVKSPEYNLEHLEDLEREKLMGDMILKIGSEANSLLKKLDDHTARHAPFASSKPQFDQCIEEFLSTDFADLSVIGAAFDELYTSLQALPNSDTQIDSDIQNAIKTFDQLKKELITIHEQKDVIEKILDLLPNFIYFSQPDLLTDSIKIDEFLKKRKKYKTFDNLRKLARLDVEKLKTMPLYRRRLATNIASTKITGMVNESWTQEKVGVNIGIDGTDLTVFVEDEAGALADPPSKRSDGFQWFLSFYVNFMAGSKGEFMNTALLLDSPGLFLHAGGQRDLLKTLESISEDNQIIFVTHSPFLIDRERLDRVRLVVKKRDRVGTTIEEKFHQSNYDTLEPIRAAIGMSLGDALFGMKKNLVVEGFSDYFILQAMSNFCERIQKNHINLSKIAIVPVGGTDKVPYFALILKKEDFKYVILLDNDTQGRQIAKDLTQKYYFEADSIVKLNDVLPDEMKGTDIEIEDLIEASFYNQAVNEAYKEIFGKKGNGEIKLENLSTSITKQTLRYEDFFKKNQLGGFNKIMVAKQIFSITSDKTCSKETVGEKTIEYFDKLFQIINKKL